MERGERGGKGREVERGERWRGKDIKTEVHSVLYKQWTLNRN